MRYALVSDIHANQQAWEAVLADTVKAGVDGIICLGDIVGYGPSPAQVLESVYEHSDMFLLGNHDAVICGRFDSDCFNDEAREIIEWTGRQLNRSAVEFFNQVPMMILGDTFAFSHAEFAVPERFDYIYDPAEAMESFRAIEQQILFCGHTHFPGTIRLLPDGHPDYRKPANFRMEEGFRYLVNVGSVGDPRNGDVRASYVIYDLEEESVDFRNVPFDIEAYRREIHRAAIPTKPILFDYADAIKPVDVVSQVREFHVDEDAVARATAAEAAAGLQRIDMAGIQARKKVVVSAGTVGDGLSFRSTSGGKYYKADRNRLAVTIGIGVSVMVAVGGLLGWSFLQQNKHDPEEAKISAPPGVEAADIPPVVDPIEAGLSEGRIVHWTFDEASARQVKNHATDLFDGEIADGKRVPGINGQALQFNGKTTKVTIAGDAQPALPHDKAWAVSFWYLFEAGGGILFAKLESSNQPGYYAQFTSAGQFEWRHMHKHSADRIKVLCKTDLRSTNPKDGWHHLLLQYDGSMKAAGVQYFVDGKVQTLEVTVDHLIGPAENAFPFQLGQNAKGQNKLHGLIDEFSLYDRELRAQEIKHLADRSRFKNVDAALAEGPKIDPKVEQATRSQYEAVKGKFLAEDFNPAMAITELEPIVNRVEGSTLADDIRRTMGELKTQIEKGTAEVIRTLDADVTPIVAKGDFAEAARTYDDYTGPFKEESKSQRSAKSAEYRSRATRQMQEAKALHAILNQHLRETFAEDLIGQRFDTVFQARSDVELEYPDLAVTPDFKSLAKEVDVLKEGRDLILSTFHPGEEVKVQLRNGRVSSFRVVEVKADSVVVSLVDNGKVQHPSPIQVSMLSSQEQFNRLNDASSPGATFFKGVVVSSKHPQEGAKLLKSVSSPLADVIASQLTEVQQDREEEEVDRQLTDFRARLGVPGDLNDKDKIREIIINRNLSIEVLKGHRGQAALARRKYGESPAFKNHEPFISTLDAMRMPVDMRMPDGAIGSWSMLMSGNKVKRLDQQKFALANDGLKRGVANILGKPEERAGEGGKLFDFTGNTCLRVEHGLGLKENAEWTITFWAKPDDLKSAVLINMGTWLGDNTSLLIGIRDGKAWLATPKNNKNYKVIKAGMWQHHIIQHKGNRTTWSIDSKQVASLDLALNLSEPLTIGALSDDKGQRFHFKGQLKDVHFYKRCLDPNELNQINTAVLSTL
jgi:predicted phosphodiesterase